MSIILAGINHQTAPLAIREKAAISAGKLPDFLSLLRSYLPHSIILSTCNRTEIYTVDNDGQQAEKASLAFLKKHLLPDADVRRYLYLARDRTAVEHLFRVACGLESMLVGEFEVLGQVGHALEIAEKADMVNLPLRHVFQSAIRTGRLVREKTNIGRNAVSASSAAVDLAERVVGDVSKCKILVIGTGEAGRLAVKVARERGVSQIVVVSRTLERASALAEKLGGEPVSQSNLAKELCSANIVVTCAGAPHYVLNFSHVVQAMRKRPGLPLVVIDIAVPRNVEPAVKQIKNVFLYNIDDLTDFADLNRRQRENEIQKATEIIASELEKFADWWQTFEVRPVVSTLMKKADDIRCAQLNRTIKKLRPLSPEEQDALDKMTKSIVTRILNEPIKHLKESKNGDITKAVKDLFHLEKSS